MCGARGYKFCIVFIKKRYIGPTGTVFAVFVRNNTNFVDRVCTVFCIICMGEKQLCGQFFELFTVITDPTDYFFACFKRTINLVDPMLLCV